jgi:hypothetical protein
MIAPHGISGVREDTIRIQVGGYGRTGLVPSSHCLMTVLLLITHLLCVTNTSCFFDLG